MRKAAVLLFSVLFITSCSSSSYRAPRYIYERHSFQKVDDYLLITVETVNNPKSYIVMSGTVWGLSSENDYNWRFFEKDCTVTYDKKYLYIRVNVDYRFKEDYGASVRLIRNAFFNKYEDYVFPYSLFND